MCLLHLFVVELAYGFLLLNGEDIQELLLLTFLRDALLYVVVHGRLLVHPLEPATLLCHAIVERLDLSGAVAATLPLCHVAFLDQSTVVDLTAQISEDHHRQVIYGDLGAR